MLVSPEVETPYCCETHPVIETTSADEDSTGTKPEAPPLAPIGRREFAQLSRGRSEIDARLDLHGHDADPGASRLVRLPQRAHIDGPTFVLVITGKATMGAESERGAAPPWCRSGWGLPEFRSLVVGFEEAHIGHGGEARSMSGSGRSRGPSAW